MNGPQWFESNHNKWQCCLCVTQTNFIYKCERCTFAVCKDCNDINGAIRVYDCDMCEGFEDITSSIEFEINVCNICEDVLLEEIPYNNDEGCSVCDCCMAGINEALDDIDFFDKNEIENDEIGK